MVVGHSFGGIVAQEMSAMLGLKEVVIISSIKSSDELPKKLVISKKLKLFKLVSRSLTHAALKSWSYKHERDQRGFKEAYMKTIIDLDDYYYLWAAKTVLHWSNIF